jgi:hypothetical protein
MSFYDSVWSLHSHFRHMVIYCDEPSEGQKRQLMALWRSYASLNVSDFSERDVSEVEMNDLTSECLLDVLLGPDGNDPCGSTDDLITALRLDPALREYCQRRTSPLEVFHLLKGNAPLVHASLIRASLDKVNGEMQVI